jgi:chemotaxis protein MotB
MRSAMRRKRVVSVVAGGLAALVLLGGCDAGKRKEALLMDENSGLRDQVHDLRTALDTSENRRRELEGENQRLREQTAARATQPAGFGAGLAGVTIEGRVGEIVAVIEGDVLFASGSTTLRPEAQRTLDNLADQIRRQFPNQPLRLVGFTDTDPIRRSNFPSNYHLGFARAWEVGQYLTSKGIALNRMSFTSFGPEMPRGSKAQSRRVELAIVTQ